MILLDTHALLWLGLGINIKPDAKRAISAALAIGAITVSAISAWEIGQIHRSKKIDLLPDAETWFDDLTTTYRMAILPLDARTAFASVGLPGDFHRDPADRFLVATARLLDVPIATRDAAILAYAAAGHVRAVAC